MQNSKSPGLDQFSDRLLKLVWFDLVEICVTPMVKLHFPTNIQIPASIPA